MVFGVAIVRTLHGGQLHRFQTMTNYNRVISFQRISEVTKRHESGKTGTVICSVIYPPSRINRVQVCGCEKRCQKWMPSIHT